MPHLALLEQTDAVVEEDELRGDPILDARDLLAQNCDKTSELRIEQWLVAVDPPLLLWRRVGTYFGGSASRRVLFGMGGHRSSPGSGVAMIEVGV